MTIFSKPKDERPPVPKLCHRCRERIGTVRLTFTASPESHPGADERESWICDECLDTVRRGEKSN